MSETSIPFSSLFASLGDFMSPLITIGLFIAIMVAAASLFYRAFRDDSTPQMKRQRELNKIRSRYPDIWKHPITGEIQPARTQPTRKRKNDEKSKNDHFLGIDEEGEAVYASDFENEAGVQEWLRSRGMEDEER